MRIVSATCSVLNIIHLYVSRYMKQEMTRRRQELRNLEVSCIDIRCFRLMLKQSQKDLSVRPLVVEKLIEGL